MNSVETSPSCSRTRLGKARLFLSSSVRGWVPVNSMADFPTPAHRDPFLSTDVCARRRKSRRKAALLKRKRQRAIENDLLLALPLGGIANDLLKQTRVTLLRFGRFLAEQLERFRRRHAATRSADDELLAQEIRLHFIAQSIRGNVHGGGHGFAAGGAAAEDAYQCFQIAAVLLIEPFDIHLGHFQCGSGDIERDFAVGLAGGIVPYPVQA